jgi:hypothetical protein
MQSIRLPPGSQGHGPSGATAENGFAFDVEVLLLAQRLGLAVAEVPVRAQVRRGSKVRVLLDGRRMLAEVWAIRRGLSPARAAWR